jgi:predicted Fe-Mo cluster-binding NifX family protein
MMNIAMPVWEGRISPLFDVAGQLWVVEVENGKEKSRCQVALEKKWPLRRVSRLVELAVTVLICGGISRSLEEALRAAGITVIAQIKGEAEQILNAFLTGDFPSSRFAMPGAEGGSEAP